MCESKLLQVGDTPGFPCHADPLIKIMHTKHVEMSRRIFPLVHVNTLLHHVDDGASFSTLHLTFHGIHCDHASALALIFSQLYFSARRQ